MPFYHPLNLNLHGDSDMPNYVSSSTSLPVPAGPYTFRNAEMAVFTLDADQSKLQDICDKYLNNTDVTETRYEVVSSMVFVVFLSMEFRKKENPVVGWMPENEVSFWIKIKADGSDIFVDLATAFTPYLFLDNYYAIVMGREVYGFRKQQAKFTPSSGFNIQALELDLNMVAFKDLNLESVAQDEYFLSIKHFADASKEQSAPKTKEEAQQAVAQKLKGQIEAMLKERLKSLTKIEKEVAEEVEKLITKVEERAVNEFLCFLVNEIGPKWVFLKQFRDNVNTEEACFQSIIKVPVKATRCIDFGLLDGRYEFHLNQLASHPLAEEFGLIPKDSNGDVQIFDLQDWFWAVVEFEV